MSKRSRKIIFIAIIVTMSFIILYVGHFLFTGTKPEKNFTGKTGDEPVKYTHISTVLNNHKQEINILDIDPSCPGVKVKPALSYNSIFGFEKLSAIEGRNNAYAAVNAGFFHEYGNPYGMVVSDGRLLSLIQGSFPVFFFREGLAELKDSSIKACIIYNNYRINITGVNSYEPANGTILYTHEFGSDNRLNRKNLTLSVVDNHIRGIYKFRNNIRIPDNGFLITFLNSADFLRNFKIGESILVECNPKLDTGVNAYQCGSWLVKDGKSVIGKRDPIVGVMTNNDPRTVIGINNKGHVILMTVDGRQPGYSTGLTGKGLTDLLLGYGINNAAMLDGGASTEMIVKGKIVNKPSDNGEERPVGGGIIVKLEEENK